ncbi:MAG: hypothetical protein L6Q60_07740 [Rhodocyclaceae bacterium]|jgi:hypothetical protein|nr:hypothetical protein [Rhodocyclaceae bacterium]
MKAARRLRPRNPVAVQPLLKKGGAHQRKDDKASRARQKVALRRRLRDDASE